MCFVNSDAFPFFNWYGLDYPEFIVLISFLAFSWMLFWVNLE